MSHPILGCNVLAGGNFWDGVREGAITTGLNHVVHILQDVDPKNLRERILKDGLLTLREANKWYRLGKGMSLTVDATKVDLNFINPNDWQIGERKAVQTLYASRDGRVYGNITLEYVGDKQFSISPDYYNFEQHNGVGMKTFLRNVFTK